MMINGGADVPRACLDPRCLLNVCGCDIPLRVAPLHAHCVSLSARVSMCACVRARARARVCVCVHA
jgi:hypothetical protein